MSHVFLESGSLAPDHAHADDDAAECGIPHPESASGTGSGAGTPVADRWHAVPLDGDELALAERHDVLVVADARQHPVDVVIVRAPSDDGGDDAWVALAQSDTALNGRPLATRAAVLSHRDELRVRGATAFVSFERQAALERYEDDDAPICPRCRTAIAKEQWSVVCPSAGCGLRHHEDSEDSGGRPPVLERRRALRGVPAADGTRRRPHVRAGRAVAMASTPSTNGNPVTGALAAVLGASALRKHLDGGDAPASVELTFDLETNVSETTRLVRNPECRGEHAVWLLEPVDDLPLAAIVERAVQVDGLARDAVVVSFTGRVLAARVHCGACGDTGETDGWRLAFAHDGDAGPCPRCGAPRRVIGFDRRERVAFANLPERFTAHTPSALGLRPGDVITLDDGAQARHYELAPGGVRAGGERGGVVLGGLGNTGSALVPLVARTPGTTHVILCDPDHYERGQQRTQAIEAADVGRPKAEVGRETIRRIAPGLCVRAYAMPHEALPLGALRGAIVLGAVDSLGARIRLMASARRVGAPFIDVAVGGGPSLFARATVYGPAADDACLECELDDYAAVDSVAACDAVPAPAPPPHAHPEESRGSHAAPPHGPTHEEIAP